jgi:hypothetical protein
VAFYGKKHFSRELATAGRAPEDERHHLEMSRDKIGEVIDAYHREMWRVLLTGGSVRLGPVGRIYMNVQAPHEKRMSLLGGEVLQIPQTVDLRGKTSPAFKEAYYQLHGVIYPEDLELFEE